MHKNLVIVESPAKAKTIEKFLGKEYIVKSSIGHIRDLPKKEMGVNIENDFEPVYVIPSEKKHVVNELKKLAKESEMIWLATDEDREGEAIAWHLLETLGLNEKKTRRIVYHEITKPAILEAFANPRGIDKNLVDAQQARRILDRLVGYELSPILWKKIQSNLSAGRVQSVAVRLLVEREREINAFQITSFYKVSGIFSVTDQSGKTTSFKAELHEKLLSEQEAHVLLEKLIGANFFIKNIEKKPSKRTPAAPFTTSTLQQEASRKMGYSVFQTMRIAQRLYEAGHITYMRTDSVNLSDFALGAAQKEIQQLFGEEYWKKRQYTTKTANAQEAHEAIRPTMLSNRTIDSDDEQEKKLYELIWKRTIASQMADAQLEKTTITISQDKTEHEFLAQGEVILFDGFLKVYIEGTDEEEENEEGILPLVHAGQKVDMHEIVATERFTQPPARYTEASLVKKLESLGIGRPSTYAPTISTIIKRKYVEKGIREGKERKFHVLMLKNSTITKDVKTEITGAEKGKLYPTDIGMIVNDFLEKYFPEIMDYNFTARVEDEFDEIARGKLSWKKMLKEFYYPFHKDVEKTTDDSERTSGERILGKDPKTGKIVLVRVGKFGPIAQIGKHDDKEKPRYAPLQNGQRIDTITLEEALKLFKLPRTLGKYEGEDVIISIGRFGPYIKHKNDYISLPKTEDPYTITYQQAIEILKAPRLPRVLGKYQNENISIEKGRFGPYIKYQNTYVSLPKDEDPFTISLEKAVELINKKEEKEKERIIKSYEEDSSVKVVKGKYGPCIQIGRKFFKIPSGKNAEELTLEECLTIAGIKKMPQSKEVSSTDNKSKTKSTKSIKKKTKKLSE
jgi:DNA topoisomerase-1